jgi:glycosyltransferase involved in cell wall biosynthesis
MGIDGGCMKILLEAPIFTSSGYGEHSRLVLRSLLNMKSVEMDFYLNPLDWGQTSWASTDKELNEIAEAMMRRNQDYRKQFGENVQYDVQIHVGIPNEFEKRAPYSVCVTAGIESDKVSADWILKTHKGINKIIVPSEHSKSGFTNTLYDAKDDKGNEFKIGCACPVEVVPYPHKEFEDLESLDLQLETKFNFLAVAMHGPRKNLSNTIHWFIDTFKDDEQVGLVLKIGHGKNSKMDREKTLDSLKNLLRSNPDRKCKIYLLHGNLTDSEMISLYNSNNIHALVSLSHGEGYGLPIFEAAGAGLPIIATDWSAHVEFLTGEITENKKKKTKKLFAKVECDIAPIPDFAVWDKILIAESNWAYPREASYKKQLKNVKNNYGMYKKWAKVLQENIKKTHEQQLIYTKMAKSLFDEVTYDLLSPISIEELPKTSIITSVYNGDEYIEGFLENMTSQSIFKEKCELVIINANSPGNEEEVILKYKEKFPDNIVYERLEEDPGIYGTWNHALSLCSGEFITNANLDDRKSLDSLEKHAIALYTDDSVDLVYTDMLITDKINETWENNSSNGRKYNMPEFSYDALKMVNMPHAAPMWRKSLHDRYGLFDDSYRSAGDWEMWLRAASAGSVFKKIPGVYNLYCFNPKGVSTNPENFSWKQEEEKRVFQLYNKQAV